MTNDKLHEVLMKAATTATERMKMTPFELRELLNKAEQDRDEYQEQLHELAEKLANARSAMVTAGQTVITAIERIQALEAKQLNDAVVLRLADAMVSAAENDDTDTGRQLGEALARAVILWRKQRPS